MSFLRAARFVPAVGWAAGIFWASSRPNLAGPPGIPYFDKAVHAGIFGVLTLLLLWAADASPPLRLPTWVWPLIATVYGVSDELHQIFVPKRQSDGWDLLADATGAFAVFGAWRWWTARRDS